MGAASGDNIYIWDLETAKREHQFSQCLADAIVNVLIDEKSVRGVVIDFGCGKGSYLKVIDESIFTCYGFEGTYGINEIADFPNIRQMDLIKPFDFYNKGNVLCLEVAEHIDRANENIFIDNITSHVLSGSLFILSWAIPGQGGCGHHNEQNAEYVIPTIEARGFEWLPIESQVLRDAGGSDLWWFKNSIYVFKKK